MSVLLPDVRGMPSGGRGLSNVLPSTEFGYPSSDGRPNSLVRGCPLIPHKKDAAKEAVRRKELLRMSEFLFFVIGTMLGSVIGVVLMCLMQINRLSERKEYADAKKKCADTFPSE